MPEDSLNLVNTSGFLFQIRIASLTQQMGFAWTVLQEQSWHDPDSGTGGYIDLVAESGWVRMVIECKRVLDGRWVFLAPNEQRAPSEKVRVLCTWLEEDDKACLEWADVHIVPAPLVRSFCVVRGQEKDRPMLENIASLVVRSTESVAEAALRLGRGRAYERMWHLPTIVTNAQLEVCTFDPPAIDSDGKLPDGVANISVVPIVQFRKSLGSRLQSPGKPPTNLEQANAASERSVLVINAGTLSETLRGLKVRER